MVLITKNEYDKLARIHAIIQRAFKIALSNVEDEDVWRSLFKFVFREDVAGVIFVVVPDFDWDDPDTTYQEDVCAFIKAFNDLMMNVKVVDYED